MNIAEIDFERLRSTGEGEGKGKGVEEEGPPLQGGPTESKWLLNIQCAHRIA